MKTQITKYVCKESQVLEGAQYRQVEDDSKHKPELAVLVGIYRDAAQIVDKNAENHQENVHRLAPCVEYQREDYGDQIPALERLVDKPLGIFLSPVAVYQTCHEVAQGECRQELEQKEQI